MTPELKTKWVEALRSGKYAQGHGMLKSVLPGALYSKYCCLGVLCEVAGFDACKVNHRGFLSEEVASAVGIAEVSLADAEGFGNHDLPSQNIDKGPQFYLAAMNDNGFNFKQIAEWIEANPL